MSTNTNCNTKAPKPFDNLTLLQDHGWRVALMTGLVAWSFHHLQVAFTTNHRLSQLVWGVTCLLCCNWLRIEGSLILLRSKLPQGELGLLLVGNLYDVLVSNPAHFLLDCRAKYGRLFSSNGFALHVMAWTEPSTSWLFSMDRKGATATAWSPTIAQLMGRGAVTNAHGEKHRALRRVLEPAFTSKATRDYLESTDVLIQQVLEEWSAAGKYHSSDGFKLLALRLFLLSAFGNEPLKGDIDTLHHDFIIWLQGLLSFVAFPIPGTNFARAMQARKRILARIETMIRTFQAEYPPDSILAKTTLIGRACYGVDEDGKPMDIEDLKDNILTMIFAGHDTSFASMGTAIHYLCEYPSIRQALQQEAKNFSEPLDFDELKSAPILNAFLAECWRHNPPAPFIFRRLLQPAEHEGFSLSANLKFNISIKLAAWNEQFYPRPQEFEIQRFLPVDHPLVTDPTLPLAAKTVDANGIKPNYPVFGGGRHTCLGHHFARLELRVFVTRLVQLYHVEERNARENYIPVNGWKMEFRLTPLEEK